MICLTLWPLTLASCIDWKPIKIVSFQGQLDEQRYVPTQLGMATLASALSPDEALLVFGEVQKARKCFVLESELHVIYQVSFPK